MLEFTSQVFRRPDEIETFLEIPLIATIPAIYSRKDRIVRFGLNAMAIMASGVVCLTYALFGVLILAGEDTLRAVLENVLNITI